jgi:hypothetical protein
MRLTKPSLLAAACTVMLGWGTAQAAEYHGVVTLYVTVYIATPVPDGDQIVCSFSVTTTGEATQNTETVTAVASGSSSTATCTLPIPYTWELATAGSDVLIPTYTVAIIPTSGTSSPSFNSLRTGTHSLPSIIGVPANGTHTSLYGYTRL